MSFPGLRQLSSLNVICGTRCIVIAAILTACSGHGAKGAVGQKIVVHLPIASYVNVVRSPDGSPRYAFPVLAVYNPAGRLIYLGNREPENRKLLQDFRARINTMVPVPGSRSLAEILNAIPDFKAPKVSILGSHEPVILSIALKNCKACTIQDDVLRAREEELLRQSINIVVIEVSIT
jgi:hypothetical protein